MLEALIGIIVGSNNECVDYDLRHEMMLVGLE